MDELARSHAVHRCRIGARMNFAAVEPMRVRDSRACSDAPSMHFTILTARERMLGMATAFVAHQPPLAVHSILGLHEMMRTWLATPWQRSADCVVYHSVQHGVCTRADQSRYLRVAYNGL